MIELIIPIWFIQVFCILILIGGVVLMFYYSFDNMIAEVILVIMIMFFVLGFGLWFVLSLFGFVPNGGFIPPGPQLFNVSVGAI